MDLNSSVTSLSGIGPVQTEKLERLEIRTIFDLLQHLPFRYEDRRIVSKAGRIQAGETVTVVGQIENLKNEYT